MFPSNSNALVVPPAIQGFNSGLPLRPPPPLNAPPAQLIKVHYWKPA